MIVGIDIGGTFTDLVCCDEGKVTSVKVPSTPDDFSIGFSDALISATTCPEDVEQIVHATTVATNALIQREGARVGLITTKGFRDVLALRRRDRRSPYGLETAFSPLIPRELRREVTERSGPEGLSVPIDDTELKTVAELLWSEGVDALLVAFLHSVTCPDNEQRALEVLVDAYPDRCIFASHQLSDVQAEFERFATAAASAYVAPLVSGYVERIASGLCDPNRLKIVTSDGAPVSADAISQNPVRTALSGPAAGVWGARHICEVAGIDKFIASDMGGTSFDACLVTDGVPALTKDRQLDFGLPLSIEMLDIATIGAGGGSIVTVSSVGTVDVGPDGVGADPGPACYGRQVHQATVTDADLVLGRIDSSLRLPSGSRELDVEAARKTMNERVANPIGVSVEAAAGLVVSTVEEKMADQIRTMALARRMDITDHVLFAYGGAGPLHAAGIAKSLGISKIVVPPNAGMFSAWGGLLTTQRERVSTACSFQVDQNSELKIGRILQDHLDQLPSARTSIEHTIDVRADGQTDAITLPLSPDDTAESVSERFGKQMGIRVSHVIATQIASAAVSDAERSLGEVLPSTKVSEERDLGTRDVCLDGDETVSCPVYHRDGLLLEDSGEGPCIIEETGATTLVPPGCSWRVGEIAMLFVERLGAV